MYQIKQGDQLELPCVTNSTNTICAWMFNGTYKFPMIGRFEYLLNPPNGDCSLRIYHLNNLDNGIWQCQTQEQLQDPSFNWPKTNLVVLAIPSVPRIVENVNLLIILTKLI